MVLFGRGDEIRKLKARAKRADELLESTKAQCGRLRTRAEKAEEEVERWKCELDADEDRARLRGLLAQVDKNYAKLEAELEELKNLARALITMLPDWISEKVPEGLDPTFYGTGSREGDEKLQEHLITKIRKAVGREIKEKP